jgi:hypothetical protein
VSPVAAATALAVADTAKEDQHDRFFAQAACTGGTRNDCAWALFNAGSEIAIVFQNINRKVTDHFQCIAPGTMAYKNLAAANYPQPANPTMNDSISSNEWTPSGAQCP